MRIQGGYLNEYGFPLRQAPCLHPVEARMDEKAFKKHLKDLAHGQHHPEEHDWGAARGPARRAAGSKTPKKAARKRKR
jgi:hypothetical protein